jgi:DNA methyltransferase 1-associated protein 1
VRLLDHSGRVRKADVEGAEDDWPREETDYLFNLAREYDLRFVVMADRWDYPTQRTIDVSCVSIRAPAERELTPEGVQDLKARYYSVCRKLVRNRPATDEQARQRVLQELSFDKCALSPSLVGVIGTDI